MAQQILSQVQDQRLQMILAPQLRQSLEILQLPVLELQSVIQQELEQNPALEEYDAPQAAPETPAEPPAPEPETDNNKEMDFKEDYEILLKLDDDWREFYQQSQTLQRWTPDDAERREHFLDSMVQSESLQEHLMAQLPMAGLEQEDRRIGELLIGSITSDGYLSTSIEELAASTGYSVQKLNEVLAVIQGFDPVGVGARDLSDCLLLQLRRRGLDQSPAANMVRLHLNDLAARKYARIAKEMNLPLETVQETARVIAALEPKPGRAFAAESTNFIHPEITIRKVDGEYVVQLDDDHLPHIRISRHYHKLLEDPATPADVKNYVQEKIRSGMFLIKSINQRQQTIYRIVRELVKTQRDFFEHGLSHLRPLTMSAIADELGIHETTVSRAISGKYVATPQGTYDLRYFFASGYAHADGQQVSNKTVKEALANLVAKESPSHPLSDQALAGALRENGFNVARRTVAKYREELKILPSHLRKA
ncbi:MAG TPA: RNA polymerase factor sigma-54 [Kiritimatiellia bacterium]|nr:RNA polymerase factor sigma-54 [Kiritimatiellia bacterium]HNS80635.1 RNA polymerase factor sigma-54 [Kiritimatiellia bacterium]HPA77714.1 RNA polymerase factor sigma-54 [Kiritimatiellia bacterium]